MGLDFDIHNASYNIAKHEAGHWLAAYKLGWKPREIKVIAPPQANVHYGYATTSFKTNLSDINEVREYARGRVKILYSGQYAESFDGENFDFEKINQGFSRGGAAYSDFWKAEEIYFFYYNCLESPKSWNDEFHPIGWDIQFMIYMHYDFIKRVAERVRDSVFNPGDEIELSSEELERIFLESKIRLIDFTNV